MTTYTRTFVHTAGEKEPFSVGEFGTMEIEFGDITMNGKVLSDRLATQLIKGAVNYIFKAKVVTSETKKAEYVAEFAKRMREWENDTVTLRGEGVDDGPTALDKCISAAWIALSGFKTKRGELGGQTLVEAALESWKKAGNKAPETKEAKLAAQAAIIGEKRLAQNGEAAKELDAIRMSILL